MTPQAILSDAFGRIRDEIPGALEHLSDEQLSYRISPDANPIGWLIWHLLRVQDDHVAGVADSEQVWTSEGFAERFALPYDVADIGYGHDSTEVAAFRADPQLTLAYADAVCERTEQVLVGLTDADWDRIVDDTRDPPVTLAVRLVSVLGDCMQHLGQAYYLRGVLGH